jgi:hypothetical protein
MKHLKLFESFVEPEKVNAVNAIFIECFLLKFFIKNDVSVKYETVHAKKPTQNEFINLFIQRKSWHQSSPEDLFTFSRRSDTFWLYNGNLIFDKVFKKIKCKRRDIEYMQVYSIKPMLKYIKYLEKTPDKKHLLIK